MVASKDPALDLHAIRDIHEMEHFGGSNDVEVLIQLDRLWPSGPQRYRVERGTSELMPSTVQHTNMASEAALFEFLDWAHERNGRERRRYFLVLWGHAYGLGFGRDHGHALTLTKLKSALARFKKTRGAKLDLLGANACAMSYAEAAYELRNVARFMVASQIAVPFVGWPYESILRRIKRGSEPVDVGRIVVDSYVNQFAASPHDDRVAMTLLNLEKAKALKRHTQELVLALHRTIQQADAVGSDRRTHLRTAFLTTAVGDVRPLIDFRGLSQELVALCRDLDSMEPASSGLRSEVVRGLQEAAQTLVDYLEPAVEQIGLWREPRDGVGAKAAFVVQHKRHPDLDGLNGLGVFTPFVTDDQALSRLELLDNQDTPSEAGHRKNGNEKSTAGGGRTEYERLELFAGLNADARWPRLVYDELREEMSSDLLDCFDSSGATTRADKAAVVQLLVSIDSAFNKLDRTVATAQRRFETTQKPAQESANANGVAHLAAFGALELLKPRVLDTLLDKLHSAAVPEQAPEKKRSRSLSAKATAKAEAERVEAAERTPFASLKRIEQAVKSIERAAQRTLTHDTFGLGPGAGFDGKPKLGLPAGKQGLGEGKAKLGEGKAKLGEGKAKLGNGADLAFLTTDGPSAAATVIELFGLVAQSFVELENAVESMEQTAVEGLAGLNHQGTAKTRLDRTFRIVSDASAEARLSLRQVLAHPLYGIGPGMDLGAAERRQLARIGGFHSRTLKLL
jgi:hypothetical protein